jgi:ABC-type transporter Mla MlaB component
MATSVKRDKDQLIVTGEMDRFSLSDKSLYSFLEFGERVNIELKHVDKIDTAGVAFLLKLVAHYQKQDKQVSISNGSAQLIALAKISNVLELLPIQSN